MNGAFTELWVRELLRIYNIKYDSETPDDILKRDPAEYERQKQAMIKQSKLYEPPKDNKVEHNDYE